MEVSVGREEELLRQMVCLLVANGEGQDAVAKKLDLTAMQVRSIVSQPASMDLIVRFQAETSSSVSQRVKKLAHLAVDVQTRILLDEKTAPAVRAKIAQEVLDRAEGKAVQVVENRNLNFDLKDAQAIDRQMAAQMQKLQRIEDMQRKLAIPVATR